VDLVGGDAVHAALRSGQAGEGSERQGAGLLEERRPLQLLADLGPATAVSVAPAAVRLRSGLEHDPRGLESAAHGALDLDDLERQLEPVGQARQPLPVEAEVHPAAEDHVPRDPREGVEHETPASLYRKYQHGEYYAPDPERSPWPVLDRLVGGDSA